MATLGLASTVLLSGCSSNRTEEEIYGMKVEELEKQVKKAPETVLTEEQTKTLSPEESKQLNIGDFSGRMRTRIL